MHVMDGAFLSAKDLFKPQALAPIRQSWFSAQRFVFDEQSSEFIGQFYRECPDLVQENLDFALPPFETTYIEINQSAVSKGAAYALKHPWPDRRGFLLTKSGSVIYTGVAVGGRHALMPVLYSLSESSSHAPQVDAPEFQPWADATSRFFFGAEITDRIDEAARAELALRYDWATFVDLEDESRDNFMKAQLGDLGLITACLLLLNQRRNVTTVEVPATRKLIGNKTWAYAKHNLVKIDVDPKVSIRGAFRIDDRASPRRHAVRGHFAHFFVTEGCDHDWVQAEDGSQRWTCSKCGGRRVWRKPYHRGDAEKGYVTKDYGVTS